jgi:hypothetical protein
MSNARSPRRVARLQYALCGLLVAAACQRPALPAVTQNIVLPQVAPPRPGLGSLVGVVADSATGYPVVGASVYFTRDSVIGTGPARPRADLPRATTNPNGGFVLRDVPPGEYTLAFSDLDHFPVRTVVVLRADQTHSVTLRPRRRVTP